MAVAHIKGEGIIIAAARACARLIDKVGKAKGRNFITVLHFDAIQKKRAVFRCRDNRHLIELIAINIVKGEIFAAQINRRLAIQVEVFADAGRRVIQASHGNGGGVWCAEFAI